MEPECLIPHFFLFPVSPEQVQLDRTVSVIVD